MDNNLSFTRFTPIEYLKIDIANSFGLDKADWSDRITWFDCERPHERYSELLPMADEPALFHAGIRAYSDAMAGIPSGYPIGLDACSSGLQLLSCLVECEASASLCGVVNTGHREDAYTNIYRAMVSSIDEPEKISRIDTKQAIMTAFYGSTAQPKKVFGTGKLLQVFYDTMESMAPGAWELNKSLQELWQPYALSHDWVLPDNFHVHVKVVDNDSYTLNWLNQPYQVDIKVNRGTKEGKSLSPNLIHSIDGMVVREMIRRCSFNPERNLEIIKMIILGTRHQLNKMASEDDEAVQILWGHYQHSGFLSARILDHLGESNIHMVNVGVIAKLIKSMPEKPFNLMTIHQWWI